MATRSDSTLRTLAADARSGSLPPRYATDSWDKPFRSRLEQLLRPGIRVLDVGGGAHPTLYPAQRDGLGEYVGLDISAEELAKAPTGSYTETYARDLLEPTPELEARFDLVVSWFVLEHVPSLEAALRNIALYTKPNGTMLLQLAGGRSPQALASRVIPHRVAVRLLQKLTDREPASVFPAHYDRCTHSSLSAILPRLARRFEIDSLYVGASYAKFSKIATLAYLMYEEWAIRGSRRDWASYFLVQAEASLVSPEVRTGVEAGLE